ncbi:MAG: hypothetical protein AAGH57_08980 [Pseudomonadota bacterium]
MSLPVGALVIISFIVMPRMWLNDFPQDIADSADPMSAVEKRASAIVGLSVVAIMLSFMSWSAYRVGFERGFWWAALHAFLVFQVFNVIDLIIDWAALAIIDPANPPIPGTENEAGWTNYRYHAIASLKGLVIGAPFAALAAGIAFMIWDG